MEARLASDAAALKLDRMLGEVAAQRDASTKFIASASHDLGQPLQAVALFFDQSLRAPPGVLREPRSWPYWARETEPMRRGGRGLWICFEHPQAGSRPFSASGVFRSPDLEHLFHDVAAADELALDLR